MLTNGNKVLKVRFISDDKYGFKNGEIYDAIEGHGTFAGVKMLCI